MLSTVDFEFRLSCLTCGTDISNLWEARVRVHFYWKIKSKWGMPWDVDNKREFISRIIKFLQSRGFRNAGNNFCG